MPALRNKKWETACRAFVLDGTTQSEAYRRGFSNTTRITRASVLANAASELFRRPEVKERILELEAEKAEVARKEFAVDAAYVLGRLVEIDRADVSDILDPDLDGYVKPISEWPKVWRQYVNQLEVEEIFAGRGDERLKIGILKKIKWPDKLRVLEMLGKHVSVNAFKEVQEIQGAGGGPLRVISTDMSPQEAAEAYADTLHNK